MPMFDSVGFSTPITPTPPMPGSDGLDDIAAQINAARAYRGQLAADPSDPGMSLAGAGRYPGAGTLAGLGPNPTPDMPDGSGVPTMNALDTIKHVLNPMTAINGVKGIAMGALQAARLPGDVLTGQVDPTSQDGIHRAVDLAMTFGMLGAPIPKPAGSLGAFGGNLEGAIDKDRATNTGVASYYLDNLRPPPMPNADAGPVTAYHGTPHNFDNFDLSKIGTGEGAQAYGHGLYFAENEGVAKSYRDNLSPQSAAKSFLDLYQDSSYGDPRESAIANLSGAITDFGHHMSPAQLDRHQQALDLLTSGQEVGDGGGHMYQVQINSPADHFLDWDAPLHQQSAHVQNALASVPNAMHYQGVVPVDSEVEGHAVAQQAGLAAYNLKKTPFGQGYILQQPSDAAGSSVLQRIGASTDPAGAAQSLRDAGVAGIRNFDGSSRNKGAGSRNYVVFDDKTIDIMRKYGMAGVLGAGGLAAMQGFAPAEGVQPAPNI